ncbi:ATP-binding protein [Erythrobacter insulae]|uniref:ATP-binding protein n=1 Tax=Erythrobacter insulae TaxID=2584124 RepID=A0A547PCK0_9SPHN|nr:ATP-binding protein [Erythrobacter insulae]TRD11859.1 ATP-binding protein [Erythrobacter insulae]
MTDSLTTSWDPLEAADGTDEELLSAAKKREIKNILKCYVSNYDPFSELLQNALDAVERRIRMDESFSPKIKVKINLTRNSIEVVDNGCGFEEAEFRSFLAPSVSFKSGGETRGNKGVGVTYIAYGFNELIIRTKNDEFEFQGAIRRGREWVEDQEGTVTRPKIKAHDKKSALFDSVDQGTSFKIKFGGNHIRPNDLGWYQATTPEQWLYLLLIKTPLGAISLPGIVKSAIPFDLIVIDKSGEERSLLDIDAIYKFPHQEVKASQKLSNVKALQQKAVDQGADVSKAVAKLKNSNGLYEVYDKEGIKSLFKMIDGDEEQIDKYNITAYGYFAYSTEIWDQINDKKAKLRKKLRILKGGLQLANNGMPQGDLITIPLTKSIGHQNQTHVIVHFENADPDLGRKGFQPELKDLAERISVAVVRQLSGRRDILKSDSGAQANIDKELKVHEWLKQQERHEEQHPLVLENESFFLPTKKISVGSIPQSEQDVIVLFNQLIAGGVIRGIKLLATSQASQYDGIFRFAAEEPFDNLYFDSDTNPLGVLEEQITSGYVSQPKILEYKYSLDGLIREFESGVKQENDVSLAVFWDMGTEFLKEYNVISLLDEDNIHQRQHHGLTHILNSAHSNFAVICLKELIQRLNDPKTSQEFQTEKYGDDI